MIDKAPIPYISAFVRDEFFPVHFAGKSHDTKRTYLLAVDAFDNCLGWHARLDDLSADNLARFWEWSQDQYSRSTARSILQRLRTMWRAANKAGHLPDVPPCPWWWKTGLPPDRKTSAESKPTPVVLPPIELPKLTDRPTTPREYLPHYVLERGLRRASASLLHFNLAAFERSLGRPATWGDFNELTINSWLAVMLKSGRKPDTMRGQRASIVALWNAAYEARIVETFPTRRVRRIKRRARRPQAWTHGDIAQLLRTIDRLEGQCRRFSNVARKDFYRAVVLLAYYSGLRLGDIFALRWSDISTDGILTVVQGKTDELVSCLLPADCLEAVSKLHGEGRELVFAGLICKRNFQDVFRRIVHAAGLVGSLKWLRRSGASYSERMAQGAGSDFLGHVSGPALARAHYLDPSIAARLKPVPPRLEFDELAKRP